jgi:hypothetical protein
LTEATTKAKASSRLGPWCRSSSRSSPTWFASCSRRVVDSSRSQYGASCPKRRLTPIVLFALMFAFAPWPLFRVARVAPFRYVSVGLESGGGSSALVVHFRRASQRTTGPRSGRGANLTAQRRVAHVECSGQWRDESSIKRSALSALSSGRCSDAPTWTLSVELGATNHSSRRCCATWVVALATHVARAKLGLWLRGRVRISEAAWR